MFVHLHINIIICLQGKVVIFFRLQFGHQQSFHHPFTFPIHFYQNNPFQVPCQPFMQMREPSYTVILVGKHHLQLSKQDGYMHPLQYKYSIFFPKKSLACIKIMWEGLTVAAMGYRPHKKQPNLSTCLSMILECADFSD